MPFNGTSGVQCRPMPRAFATRSPSICARSSRSRIRLKARWLPCGNSPLFENLAGSEESPVWIRRDMFGCGPETDYSGMTAPGGAKRSFAEIRCPRSANIKAHAAGSSSRVRLLSRAIRLCAYRADRSRWGQHQKVQDGHRWFGSAGTRHRESAAIRPGNRTVGRTCLRTSA